LKTDRLGRLFTPFSSPTTPPIPQSRMVWTHYLVNGGRKIVRPLVENAIIDWKM